MSETKQQCPQCGGIGEHRQGSGAREPVISAEATLELIAEIKKLQNELTAERSRRDEARAQRDWIIKECERVGVTVNVAIGAPITEAYRLVNEEREHKWRDCTCGLANAIRIESIGHNSKEPACEHTNPLLNSDCLSCAQKIPDDSNQKPLADFSPAAGSRELLEDEDGAPYPDHVQKEIAALREQLDAATNALKKACMRMAIEEIEDEDSPDYSQRLQERAEHNEQWFRAMVSRRTRGKGVGDGD